MNEMFNDLHSQNICTHELGRTGPPGCLALTRWAGWSAGQVDLHLKCWASEWNRGRGPEALS